MGKGKRHEGNSNFDLISMYTEVGMWPPIHYLLFLILRSLFFVFSF